MMNFRAAQHQCLGFDSRGMHALIICIFWIQLCIWQMLLSKATMFYQFMYSLGWESNPWPVWATEMHMHLF